MHARSTTSSNETESLRRLPDMATVEKLEEALFLARAQVVAVEEELDVVRREVYFSVRDVVAASPPEPGPPAPAAAAAASADPAKKVTPRATATVAPLMLVDPGALVAVHSPTTAPATLRRVIMGDGEIVPASEALAGAAAVAAADSAPHSIEMAPRGAAATAAAAASAADDAAAAESTEGAASRPAEDIGVESVYPWNFPYYGSGRVHRDLVEHLSCAEPELGEHGVADDGAADEDAKAVVAAHERKAERRASTLSRVRDKDAGPVFAVYVVGRVRQAAVPRM